MTQQENIRDRERFERYLTAAITGLLANATRFERLGQNPVDIANEAWEIARMMQATVQKWEIGEKRPSGPSLKLLDVIQRKGIGALS